MSTRSEHEAGRRQSALAGIAEAYANLRLTLARWADQTGNHEAAEEFRLHAEANSRQAVRHHDRANTHRSNSRTG